MRRLVQPLAVVLACAFAPFAASALTVGAGCKTVIERDANGNVLRCGDIPKCTAKQNRAVFKTTNNLECIPKDAKSLWDYAPHCSKGQIAEITRRQDKDGAYFAFDCVAAEKASDNATCAQQPWRCNAGKVWKKINDVVVPPDEIKRRSEACAKLGLTYINGYCASASGFTGIRG